MASRRPSRDHQAAVARRLALLNLELGAAPDEHPDENVGPVGGSLDEPPPWWDQSTRVAIRRPGGPGRRSSATPPVVDVGVRSAEPVEPDPDPPLAPALPRPGRHAARHQRVGPPLRVSVLSRFPSAPFGAAHVAVVALVASVALAVTAWVVLVSDERPLDLTVATPAASGPALVDPSALTAPAAQASSAAAGAPGAPAGAGEGNSVVVDVAGKVRRPGIAVLPAGSRVVDAVEAAGGARRGVELASLNLARILVDGEQILVGVAPAGGAAASAVAVPGAPGPSQLLNLNTASAAELDLLPQVGPVTASAILAYRDEQGGFASVDELLEVDGIGEVTLARIAPFVTV